ncbi:MAG: hypothetical protein EPN39_03850 [Chitinophagaceae bacterium]|nr:MAG: hypothetical protein EPN39_03850 [Chitinophagaceae bacterium]
MTQEEFINELKSHYYNTEDSYRQWLVPIREFLVKNINNCFNGVVVLDVLNGMSLKKRPSNQEVLNLCSRLYTNRDILQAFYESNSKEDKMIIEKAVWSGSLNYQDINKIYGREVIYAQKGNSHYPAYTLYKDKVLEKWFHFIQVNNVWYPKTPEAFLKETNLHIVFPLLMRQIYSDALPKPEGYYLKPASLPEKVTVFNAEKNIFLEIPLILAHYFQGNLRYTQKGYPNMASGQKMGKVLQLKDFPGDPKGGLRALMIAGLFTDSFILESLSEPAMNILQQLLKTNFDRHPVAPYLLCHLKGLASFDHRDFNKDITDNLFEAFRNLPSGEWITFENMKQYASTHFISLRAISSLYDIEKLTIAEELKNKTSRIDGTNAYYLINDAILGGHIYLLAAFGMMEIAVNEATPLKYSYYDGLYAFRLTALGAYLLGVKADYAPPDLDNETKLSFDEQAPVIRVEGNLALGQAMLDKYAEKVSENRYQFSPGKFLKDCKSKSDLNIKMEFFKQTVRQQLPPFWNEYLNQLLQNSHSIKIENTMEIFKLPQGNKELHRLVAQDNILRPLIIKAEKFYVLVEKNNIARFLTRMKELGYLIG